MDNDNIFYSFIDCNLIKLLAMQGNSKNTKLKNGKLEKIIIPARFNNGIFDKIKGYVNRLYPGIKVLDDFDCSIEELNKNSIEQIIPAIERSGNKYEQIKYTVYYM